MTAAAQWLHLVRAKLRRSAILRRYMADSALAVKAQTIKQAKAAYKARGGAVSEEEQRRIDRQVQLSQRAWRLREQEKRKNEAAKKRQEREKEEASRAFRATQFKRDKFGYKSSQMHIGAFFGGGTHQPPQIAVAKKDTTNEFEDDGVDDETLLHALGSPSANNTGSATTQGQAAERQAMTASLQLSNTESTFYFEHGLDSFWDELDSSTQIARELTNDDDKAEPRVKNETEVYEQASFSCSFNSNDFDLTADDLDELIATKVPLKDNSSSDRQLMPPPAVPAKTKSTVTESPQTSLQSTITHISSTVVTHENPAQDFEFSMSQLESFVEDDLQLTQIAPD
ncbi:Hypothetical protein R9X50_00451500 [Acrodontium crateriforme]|uniref:Uncharacterized protein n=1 Tax=Acrodontium crateriforme TaxID=150365 RepID=A0AAQ3RAV4_9PEZI|nr:Hypothetical protein R9X50_00451500 [Acrodontium crateriforme]